MGRTGFARGEGWSVGPLGAARAAAPSAKVNSAAAPRPTRRLKAPRLRTPRKAAPGSLGSALRAREVEILGAALAACSGNVSATARHLVLDRVVLHDKLNALGLADRARELRAAHRGIGRVSLPPRPVAFWEDVENLERRLVADALVKAHGNISRAARKLKTDRGSLLRRLRRVGLWDLARHKSGRPPGPMSRKERAGRRRKRRGR